MCMCIPSHMITVDVHLGPNPKGGIEESVKTLVLWKASQVLSLGYILHLEKAAAIFAHSDKLYRPGPLYIKESFTYAIPSRHSLLFSSIDFDIIIVVMGEFEFAPTVLVSVREFDPNNDREGVEAVERICEVGPNGKLSLFTDLHGDPICRVRNSPTFLMLIAEIGQETVGMIRGCIKTVTCGKKLHRQGKSNTETEPKQVPIYTKLAYILGLRVSPHHRRMGIGFKLVQSMEEWFRDNGAEYAYMATEKDNVASVKLFTDKCGYSKFRTPCILANPVFAHHVRISNKVTIIELSPNDAELLYRSKLATTEFFPRDVDSVLGNRLSLGTFLAVPRVGSYQPDTWSGSARFLLDPPPSWAILSVWNCKDVFTLEVKGVSRVKKTLAKTTRVLDRVFPWLRLPSVPNFFEPFGFLFLYGLGGEGPQAQQMLRALCGFAHNLAKDRGCEVVATEVSSQEPLRCAIPHWKMLSCEEDLWCIKRLGEDYSDGSLGDWTKSPPGFSIFVDPREV
ncbi:putative N-acetyltransferase HLS1-like [Glycine soja]|nr:putative N-acetyltransferase HLS1-like [Glycine max]RZC11875.1 putative N-acetyltransferase HLS1-like [Glycine soja]